MSKKKPNHDHIVVNAGPDGKFECLHCGETDDPGYPLSIEAMVKNGKLFTDVHGDCLPGANVRTLTFTGMSDDTVRVDSSKEGSEEYSCFQRGEENIHAEFHIGREMKIYAIYDGCWMFAVGQMEEDTPLPEWPIRVTGSSGYTSILEITAPVSAKLKHADGE